MKLENFNLLIAKEPFAVSDEWRQVKSDIERAVSRVVWPPGNDRFLLFPDKGRGRGQGNGVVPIKQGFLAALEEYGWETELSGRLPKRFDAIKNLSNDHFFGLEWETGNVSSTHRSVNRILLARAEEILIGGAIILPTRDMYQYLTDRVGNYREVEPYFRVWQHYPWDNGVLAVVAVEHDGVSENVPRIEKGTDGRALV